MYVSALILKIEKESYTGNELGQRVLKWWQRKDGFQTGSRLDLSSSSEQARTRTGESGFEFFEEKHEI